MDYISYHNDRVFFVKNAISNDEINHLLEISKSNFEEENFIIRGYYNNGKPFMNGFYKNMSDKDKFIFSENEKKFFEINYEIFYEKSDIIDGIHNKIFSIISEILEKYMNENIFEYKPISNILLYKDGHHMTKHTDNMTDRICTSVLYLNENLNEDSGGQVVFYNDIGEAIKIHTPNKNELIIFNGFLKPIIHSVNKIHNWDRKVFRTYWEFKNL